MNRIYLQPESFEAINNTLEDIYGVLDKVFAEDYDELIDLLLLHVPHVFHIVVHDVFRVGKGGHVFQHGLLPDPLRQLSDTEKLRPLHSSDSFNLSQFGE